jgi:hypothetical protein
VFDLNVALLAAIGFDNDAHYAGVGKVEVVLEAHARVDRYLPAV